MKSTVYNSQNGQVLLSVLESCFWKYLCGPTFLLFFRALSVFHDTFNVLEILL